MSHEYSERGDYGAAVAAQDAYYDSLTDAQLHQRAADARADSVLNKATQRMSASYKATLRTSNRTPDVLLKAAEDAEAFARAARELAEVREG